MNSYSIIQKSQLEGAHRIDAEYYQPEYLEVVDKMSKIPHDTLENISESLLSFGAYSLTSFIQWKESGIPFITAQDVKEGFIDFANVRFIDEKVDEILKKSRVHEDEVLLAMSGKVGDAAIAVNIPSRLNSNQDIVKIKLKKDYSPYFLAVFLNSKFGRLQVLRLPVGSVQQHIFLWQTKSLLIPNFPKTVVVNIENLYKSALTEIQNSNTFYQQAESLLLEELGLSSFAKAMDDEKDLSWIVNLSDVKNAKRIDAEFYQPKFENIFKNVKFPLKTLGELSSFLNHSKQPPYVEGGSVPIITQRHLGKITVDSGLLSEPETKLTDKEWLGANINYELRAGDVLYYSVGAYIGKTNIILEDMSDTTAASFLTIIRPKDEMNSFYLAVVLNSIVGQLQSEKWQSATAQQYIYPKDIRRFKIPVLPKSTQEKIAELVRKSHEARKKSKQLLEKAKREVEEMIEKGR